MFHKIYFSQIFKFLVTGYPASKSKVTKMNLKPHKGNLPWESNSQQSAFNLMLIRPQQNKMLILNVNF